MVPELKKVASPGGKFDFDHIDNVELAKDRLNVVADDAANGYVDPTLVITPEESARLRKRIHKRILPLLCLAYLCQALDKATTGTSS